MWRQRLRLLDPNDPVDTVFTANGPRQGKDRLGSWMAVDLACRLHIARWSDSRLNPLVHVWVTAPSRGDFDQVWREFSANVQGIPHQRYPGHKIITLFGDKDDRRAVLIEFKSGWEPDRLKGVGLDIDYRTEWATFKPESDNNLDDRGASPGRAGIRLLNGQPTLAPSRNYRNAFNEAEAGHARYIFQNAPTWENPFIMGSQRGREALERIREGSSELRWACNQGAELPPEGAGIPGLRSISTAQPAEPEPGRYYIHTWDPAGVGKDWNWHNVYTRDEGGLVQVQAYRWKWLPPEQEEPLLAERMRIYPGEFYFDQNAQDRLEGMLERIAPGGMYVEGHKWTRPKKASMVDGMVRAIGAGDVRLLDPDCSDEARDQFNQLSEFDQIKLNAPEGAHDDAVTCVFLAVHVSDTGSSVDANDALGYLVGG